MYIFLAENAVRQVEVEEQSLQGVDDPRIQLAQQKIDQLPLNSLTRTSLQGRLNAVKGEIRTILGSNFSRISIEKRLIFILIDPIIFSTSPHDY